jgi:hypothetical protein
LRKYFAAVSVAVAMLAITAGAGASQFSSLGFVSRAVPKHIKTPPFTFTNLGRLKLPKFVCPTGVTNPAYCSAPPAGSCSGKVKVIVSLRPNPYLDPKGGKVIKRFTTTIKSNCHWRKTVTFPPKELSTHAKLNYLKRNAYVGIDFKASFMGNQFVKPIAGRTQTVIAEIQELK